MEQAITFSCGAQPPANRKICYLIGSHDAYRVSGEANIECLRNAGAEIVASVEDADIVVIHDEPWLFPRYLMMAPEAHRKYIIAYCVWETTELPEVYRHNLDLVDEIWTPSSYCREVLCRHHDNVHVIPHIADPVEADQAEIEELKHILHHDPDEFYFYSITKTAPARKNLQCLLQVMPKVLRGRKARFILKTDMPVPDGWRPPTDQVIYLPGTMSKARLHALHHIGNCLVSAHCSEGWGLCLSEAMTHGNLVVATGHGGNMDFMTEENSLPVRYRMAPAAMNTVWRSEGQWASVDEDELAARLIEVHEHWHDLEPMRDRARKDMETFNSTAVTAIIGNRLQSFP